MGKRVFVTVTCPDCAATRKVRKEYQHKPRCKSCTAKRRWQRPEYSKKCSEAHKGQPSGRRKATGEASFNRYYYCYRQSARERGFVFSLTIEEFRKITTSNCVYCGSEPTKQFKGEHSNGYYLCNGIDRINNLEGYHIGNAVACCKICNYAKRDISLEQFLSWLERIRQFSIDINTLYANKFHIGEIPDLA